MEPTIYNPGIYKTPGVYKGDGGIYKGRGVYKSGEGGGGPQQRTYLHTICNRYDDNKDVPLIGPASNSLPNNCVFDNPGYTFTENATFSRIYYIADKNTDYVKIRFRFSNLNKTCSVQTPFGRIEYHDSQDLNTFVSRAISIRNVWNTSLVYSDLPTNTEGNSRFFILKQYSDLENVLEIEAVQNESELTYRFEDKIAVVNLSMYNRMQLGLFLYNIAASNSKFSLLELLCKETT